MKKRLGLFVSGIFLSICLFHINIQAAIGLSDFDNKLESLRKAYSDYSVWTGRYDGGSQCWGFARLIADKVFNDDCRQWETVSSISNVKSGDILQYGNESGQGHTVFVTKVSGNIITFLDCNGNGNYSNGNKVRNCGIKWDNTIKKTDKMFGKYPFSYLLSSPGINSNSIGKYPIGHVDSIWNRYNVINVNGWANDDDTPGQNVTLRLEIVGGRSYEFRTDGIGSSGYPGFSQSIEVEERGKREVNVYVLDQGPDSSESRKVFLTKAILDIETDSVPIGSVDAIGGGENVIGLSGWASDPDTPGEQVTLRLEVGDSQYEFKTGEIGSSGYPSFSLRIPVKEKGEQYVKVFVLDQGTYGSPSKDQCIKKATINIATKHMNSYIDTYTEKIASTVGAVVGMDGRLRIEGWVQDVDGIDKVEYEMDGGVKGICEHRDRPDVAKANPGYPTGKEGFYAYIPYRDIRYAHFYAEYVKITLRAYCKSGDIHTLGSIEVKRDFPEKTGPTISNIRITDVSDEGYTVQATVTDSSGIERVQFPTWTLKNGQDDIIGGMDMAALGTLVGNTATFHVKTSDHNNETGMYKTHIYAYDKYGNVTAIPANDTKGEVNVPEKIRYTVKFDANGGSDEPAIQYKAKGQSITISDVIPIRPGYTFVGWEGSTQKYQAGSVYTADKNETLQAIWVKGEHDYIRSVTKDATCIEKGIVNYKCSKCGDTFTEEIALLSHTDTEIRGKRAASCTETGYTGDTYCTFCGKKIKTGSEISKTGHRWDKGVITKPATVASDGIQVFTCQICGSIRSQKIGMIDKTEEKEKISPGEIIKDNTSDALYVCGDVGTNLTYLKPLNTKKTAINIPDTIKVNGIEYAITSIGRGAFKNNRYLKKIEIGSQVITIGDYAFMGCSNLKTVTIGKKVETIGKSAFNKCISLAKITIPTKVTMIQKRAFYNCRNLKTLVIKTSTLNNGNIGNKAFGKTHAKAMVKVPAKVLKSYKRLFTLKGMAPKVKYTR